MTEHYDAVVVGMGPGGEVVAGLTLDDASPSALVPVDLRVTIDAGEPCSALLIGGTPLPEPLLMWWNYVARTRDEIIEAHRDWMTQHERFGQVDSPLTRLVTDGPPWSGYN